MLKTCDLSVMLMKTKGYFLKKLILPKSAVIRYYTTNIVLRRSGRKPTVFVNFGQLCDKFQFEPNQYGIDRQFHVGKPTITAGRSQQSIVSDDIEVKNTFDL